MRVLVTRPIPEIGIELLKSGGHEVTVSPHDRALAPVELLRASEDADALLTTLADRIDAAFLDVRPTVRAIAQYAVGFNNIDVAACTARRIGVCNTPEVLTNATAEIAWMLLMAAARRVGEAERDLRAKRWEGWGPLQYLGLDVVGKTLGIYGAGRIGARFAKMAAGFEMQVIYHNRKPSEEMNALGAAYVPFDEMVRRADFISVHVPLTAETRHRFGAREFALMKPTAVIVNTARGPVIDESALVEALKEKRIFAAGLDVFEEEPTLHPGLYALENVVLLPHIGSATIGARDAMAKLAAENLIAMLAGKRPPAPVNPELWM